ncbi:putative protein with domain of unknown function (DUF4211) [Lyophyllum shimeji]|uniref:DUF4211 domain-containing protein n=1 Tax=Lyophyllum shimeji TaxID=47721 RepID=A0A9P3UI46_LYOSH|nr:putative protein with domain of unknown function (DUF4211) [Lyophyllum shimeji]
MPPKSKFSAKPLRQTTLFDTPVRATPSKLSSPSRTKRKRNAIITRASDDEDDVGLSSIKFEPEKSTLSSDDGVVASVPKRRRMAPIVDSDDSAGHVKRKLRLTKRPTSRRSEDESDDTQQPRRRKLKKKRPVALTSSSDDEDLAEEVDKEHIIASRFRQRDKKTAFQKNLEKLKRRKQKQPSVSPSEEESGEDEDGSENQDTPFKGAKPSSDFDSLFDEDSDTGHSSDFIVEDDNTAVAELPPEFSMDTYQDLDYQFKRVFQFFVHIAVRPAKERHHFMKDLLRKEQYFSGPLQNARRKLSGLRDSLVASSVWRPEFKKALETYPNFELIPLDFAVPNCDACHLGGRLSTLTGRLSGLPYDRWGFEIKEKKRSLSPDSSDTETTCSEDDPAVVEFQLGRFCAKRTRVYHEFTHWEYALFKCIREEVDELHECEQSRGFFPIAYAGGKKPPKDLDDADGICDWLDQRKVIDMEWTKLKDMMESARHLELEKKGDAD